jgi:hypothetical protein
MGWECTKEKLARIVGIAQRTEEQEGLGEHKVKRS